MTTELQIAPTPEIREREDGIEDIPDMVAHLYPRNEQKPRLSRCGILNTEDPHAIFHYSRGIYNTACVPGTSSCPACGAPLCPICYSLRYGGTP